MTVTVVVGVGPGLGAGLARRFAREGHLIALVARKLDFSQTLSKELPGSKAYACDVAKPDELKATFASIRADLGDPENLLYNAGSGTWATVEEISVDDFEHAWKVNALGSLIASQEVIPAMKRAKRGNIVFTGATASRRGNVKTAAFAPAKAAQKSLAESMARHLWPSGIHVALVIVDGAVASERSRKNLGDRPESSLIQPDDVAETVYQVTKQNESAWSFEVEARPSVEKW